MSAAVTEDDAGARTPLTLVLNWPALLKELSDVHI
jgi:hypothetical protein